MTTLSIIQNKIYKVRDQKVMLDFDLAAIYGVETKRLNEQVKRNLDRFSKDFMFRLTKKEWEIMKSQIATSSGNDKINSSQIATSSGKHRGSIYLPYAFTEHGITMLNVGSPCVRAALLTIII